jgi:monoterpene epsilon-lactone hydrolase
MTGPRPAGHTCAMADRSRVLPFPKAPDGVELRHLRAFVAVAEELNFGRAAERLYVSQPALSRQIRGLEELVGCELLRRSTHSVELTLAGEALLGRSRNLLRDVDEAVATALAVGGELLGRVARSLEPLRGMLATDPDLVQTRAAFESLNAQFSPPAGTVTRPVTAGGVPSLLVAPGEGHEPTVLYLHGGGYVIGSAFGYQPHAGALAAAAETGLLVADYRLAPEHPFPAALEDAQRAYLWLREHTPDPQGIVVVGDSSGAGLLLSLLLSLKRDEQPLPAASVAFCPWLDHAILTASTSDAPMSTEADVHRCISAYLADHPADDPIVDSLHADLTGLPPMLIQAATGDARLADAKALATRAQDHGVQVRLELFPVQAHAFQLFWSFLPEAADAMEAAGAFIRERASDSAAQRAPSAS